jgi:hypothetical protein
VAEGLSASEVGKEIAEHAKHSESRAASVMEMSLSRRLCEGARLVGTAP